jgi:glutamate-1-semialdehyde 2,1-aminomutase
MAKANSLVNLRHLSIDRRLLNEAKRYIPGGVNSPVRSFGAVGGYPVFIKRAYGSRLYGESGRQFIDYCLSWGALILGHAYPKVVANLKKVVKDGTSFGAPTRFETELARLIVEAIPSIEQVRLTNSGTEAVMAALRLARAFTGKDKIVKFEGSYHGHADYLLVKSGSGQATFGLPGSLGLPKDFTKYTLLLPFNDARKLKETLKKYQRQLAAIIVEPVMANCGLVLPKEGFLQTLRKLASKYNIVLIFDEVITGFRLSYGGAQRFFSVLPDLTCLGKIIGGGLPVGAFGGNSQIMRLLAPSGGVYQAGTLSGNPIAVTAGLVTLKKLKETNPYGILEDRTRRLCQGIESQARARGLRLRVNYISSIFSIFFTEKEVIDYKSARAQDAVSFKKFFHSLLREGIYLSPSGFEANFLSAAHSESDIDRTLRAVDKALRAMH